MCSLRDLFAELLRLHDDSVLDRQDARVFSDTVGHHVAHGRARLGPVKAFRFASTPDGAVGLDRPLARATDRPLCDGRGDQTRYARKERSPVRHLSITPRSTATISAHPRGKS